MNRILFEKDEIRDGVATFDDVRAEHVLGVLHGEVGQVLKTGEVDGKVGTGVILSIADLSPDGLRPAVRVRCTHDKPSRKPWVDLVLAPPRPRVMKRLLPQLATLGVGRIFLVGAKKVEKDFWGATLLKPENYRPLLIDGLMQAGTSILPTLETRRNFRTFVKEELDALWPNATRIVAHPYGAGEDARRETSDGGKDARRQTPDGERTRDKRQETSEDGLCLASRVSRPRPLLAIGPEGGWTDEEVALLEERGFARYSLGSRILRTDTATIALLAQLMKEFDR